MNKKLTKLNMKFSYLFPFQAIFFFEITFQSCIGNPSYYNNFNILLGDITQTTCYECASNYYLSPNLLHLDSIDSNTDCYPKDLINDVYNQEYFVSNITCSSSAQCVGNKTFPFDSVIKALNQIHVGDLAGKFQSQIIKIYFLGNSHYILDSDLNFHGTRFFRRMNSTVTISPWFCEDEILIGCLYREQSQRVDLLIKTFGFNFEVYRSFKLVNINLIANDIILKNTTSKTCYNSQTFCCNESSMSQTFDQDECGINNLSLNLKSKSQLTKMKAFFQIRLLYNENMTLNSSLSETPMPTLSLINVTIRNFYLVSINDSDIWFNLISFGTLGYNLIINNVALQRNYFTMGLFYFSVLEEDPYYRYLNTGSQYSSLYAKYPASNLYFSTISINGLIVSEYFGYSISLSGNIVPGIINLYGEVISNISYEFNNTNIQNNNLGFGLYFLSFSSALPNIPRFYFLNYIFQNNSNMSMIQTSSCNITFDQIIISNVSVSRRQNVFILLGQSGFALFQNGQFSLMNLNADFMDSTNYEIIFLNSSFGLIQNTFAIQMISGRLNLSNLVFFSAQIQNPTVFSLQQTNVSIIDSKFLKNSQGPTPSGTLYIFYVKAGSPLLFYVLNLKIDNWLFLSSVASIFYNVDEVGFAQHGLTHMENLNNVTFLNVEVLNVIFNVSSLVPRAYFLNFKYALVDQLFLKNCTFSINQGFNLMYLTQGVPEIYIFDTLIENSTCNYYLLVLSLNNFLDRPNWLTSKNLTIRNLHFPVITRWLTFFNCIQMSFEYLDIRNITHKDYYSNHYLSNYQMEQFMIFDQNSWWFSLNNSYLEAVVECNYNVLVYSCLQDTYIVNVTFVSINNDKLVKLTKALWIELYSYLLAPVYLTNCSFYNFTSFQNIYVDSLCENGVVYVAGFANFYAHSNYFSDNTADIFWVFSLSGMKITEIINTTLINSQSNEGGAIMFYSFTGSDSNITVDTLNIVQSASSTASNGGAIYIDNVYQRTLKNVLITNSNAGYGGAISFNNVTNAEITNIKITNSTSSYYGGAFDIFHSLMIVISLVQVENVKANYGGFIYSDSSSFRLLNCFVNETIANNSGGAFYLVSGQDSDIKIEIDNSSINFCYAEFSGSCLTGNQLQYLRISNSEFVSSWAKPEVNVGIIQLSTFYEFLNISDYDVRQNIFEKVKCSKNIAQVSCFYLSSNLKMTLSDCLIFNSSGSALFLESDGFNDWQTIKISNFSTFLSNSFDNDMIRNVSNALITINNAKLVEISNLQLQKNFHFVYLISIKYSEVSFINSTLSDYVSIGNFLYGYFYLINSKVVMINIEIYYSNGFPQSQSPILVTVDSYLTLNQSVFSNVISNSFFIFSLRSSQSDNLFIFFNNSFIKLGAATSIFYVSTTNIFFLNCSFISNLKNGNLTKREDNTLDLYFLDKTNTNQLFILGSTFENQGGGNSISIIGGGDIDIISSLFASTEKKQISNVAIFIDSASKVSLNLTIIKSFSSELGAGVTIYKRNFREPIMNIIITNCEFINNSASLGGAIFLRGNIILRVFSCSFIENKARNSSSWSGNSGVGGCLVSDCEYYPLAQVFLNNSVFSNNTADKYAPTFLVKNTNYTDLYSSNTFITNSDNLAFSDTVVALPIQYYILNSDNSIFAKFLNKSLSNTKETNYFINTLGVDKLIVTSGQPFNFSIIMTDNYNQTLYFESESFAKMQCSVISSNSTDNSAILSKESSTADNGVIFFFNVTVIKTPPANLSCTIAISSDDSLLITSTKDTEITFKPNRNYDLGLSLILRDCNPGEILMVDQTCRICSPNTYSLKDPMIRKSAICLPCPENAICLGGSSLRPIKGSWRYSITSSLVLKCPTEESCLGFDQNNDSVIQGVCEKGYWGNLCYNCESGLGRSQENGVCEPCSEMVWIYLKIVLGFIFIVLYTYTQASIYSKMDQMEIPTAVLLKQFINHFQILAMITLVNFNWGVNFEVYFSIQEYFSCLYQDFFNIDCLIQSVNQNLLSEKIIFEIMLPVIFSLIMLIVWLIVYFHKLRKHQENLRKSFILDKIRTSFIVLIFIFYPEILRKCFIILNCILIDDSSNLSVLKYSPEVVCWGFDHLLWALAISLPGILIWGILTPIILFCILFKNQEVIRNLMMNSSKMKTLPADHSSNCLIKCTFIVNMEPKLKEMFFPNVAEFPLIDSITYNLMNQKIYETIEINVKSKEEIMQLIVVKQPETTKNLLDLVKKKKLTEDFFQNKNFMIKDPLIFYSYIEKYPSIPMIPMNKMLEIDLKTNLLHIMTSFELMEESNENIKHQQREHVLHDHNRTTSNIGNANQSQSIFKNLGFLYKGYKEEYYYWEIVFFSRKFFLIMLGAFSEVFSGKTQNMNLMWFLFVYYFIQNSFQPYAFDYLNRIESTTLKISLLTALMGVLLFIDFFKSASIFFLTVAFLINVYFLGLWIYYVQKYGNLQSKWKRFVQKIYCKFGNTETKKVVD